MFYGRNKAHIEAKSGQRIIEEYFADIKVNVASGPRDIYSALDGAYDVQEVSLADGTFPQYTSIAVLPPVLQIHVQRVQYDKESRKMYKSDSHLKLRETIYMDRYLDSGVPDLLEKRRDSWRWKEELRRLEARRDALSQTKVCRWWCESVRHDVDRVQVSMSVPEMFAAARDWLVDVQSAGMEDFETLDPTLLEALQREANNSTKELEGR